MFLLLYACGEENAAPPRQEKSAPAAPGAPSGPRPSLLATEEGFDFGPLLQGETRTHGFRLANAGAAPVTIHQVRTDCGCALAKVLTASGESIVPLPGSAHDSDLLTLAPGEECEIVVELLTQDQRAGRLEKSAQVRSDDPARPTLHLRLSADIAHAFTLEPESAVFSEVARGETPESTILVRPAAKELEGTRIVGFTEVPAYLEASCEERLDDAGKRSFLVTIRFKDCAPVGYLQPRFLAQLDHPTFTSLPLKVTARVRSRIRFDTGNPDNRELIEFAPMRPGEVCLRRVEIRNEQPERPYTVTGVEVDSKDASLITPEVVTLEAGVHYRIDVSALPSAGVRYLRGSLRILSDHPDQPVKEIPFQGWLEGRR
ncbi:MAG: DUF1573 domain-containing protein [Planctomycetes bacterium]|nr:DUF1573 domain-containing protein [Planctomycetota bacterium]